MNKESDFSDKWQHFLKTIKSALLLEFKRKTTLNEIEVNNIIKSETLSWLNPNVSKGVYLQTIYKKNQQLGKRFEDQINNLRYSGIMTIKNISSSKVTFIMTIISLSIFGLLYKILSYNMVTSIGFSALFLLILTPLCLSHIEKWNQKNISQKVDEIINDLDRQGNVLKSIVKEFEQNNEPVQ